jgi:type IV pilus assembly protein PilB
MAKSSASGNFAKILLKRNMIEPEKLEELLHEAESSSSRLEKLIVEKNIASPESVALALAEYLDIRPLSLKHFIPPSHLLELIPRETMTRRKIMPVCRVGKTLTVAFADPFDLMTVDELSTHTGLKIALVVAPEIEIQETIS